VFKEWKQGAYVFLQKNKFFFAAGKNIDEFSIGPNIDGIIFKIFGTSDTAILSLKKGSIDMFWWNVQPGYLEDLKKHDHIKIFSSEKTGFIIWASM